MPVKIDDLPDWVAHPAVAAALGSALGLKALPGASLPEKLVNLGASFALAVYAGPALVEYLEVSSPKLAAGIVFGIGATGLVVFNALIDAIKRSDLGAWFLGWLPKKPGGQ